MSLLNDALRKKKSEHHPVGKPLGASLPEPASGPNRKQLWIIVSCCLVLFAAICGAWLYWSESDASSDLAVRNPATVLAETDSEDLIGKPQDGDTISIDFPNRSLRLCRSLRRCPCRDRSSSRRHNQWRRAPAPG